MECRVFDLGLADHLQVYQQQKQFVQNVLKDGRGCLLFCEHPAVFTLGRNGSEDFFLQGPRDNIRVKEIPIVRIDRGGEVTFHGPGQLVAYPIFPLASSSRDLKIFLRKLEEVVIDLLKDFGIVANRQNGFTGVWVGSKKIASLGIGVKKWVSYHGLGLNVNTDLNYFSMIKPCGLNVEMTSMAQELGAPVDMAEVKTKLVGSFRKEFSLKILS